MSIVTGSIEGATTMATPLLWAALGENVAERAGVVNVGIEGTLLTGAFAAMLGSRATHDAGWGLLAGALAGVVIAALFAVFAIALAANQVVVGVVMNLLALGVTGTIYRAMFGATGAFIQTPALARPLWDQTVLTPLAMLAVPAIWWWLTHTRSGLTARACGEEPAAADAAGVNVAAVRAKAVLFGGAMAGVAGAFLSVAQTNTFAENMSAGRGFIALAIVTAGRWNPWGCLIAALVFGSVDELQIQLQAQSAQVPYNLLLALPYVATLLILAFGGRFAFAPAALGRVFQRA